MNSWKKLFVSVMSVCILIPISSLSAAELGEKPAKPLVPIRAFAQDNGAKLSWEASTKKITLEKNKTTLVLTIGEKDVVLNGKTLSLEQPIQVTKGTAYVDEDFMKQALAEAPEDIFIDLLSKGEGTEAAKYVNTSAAEALPTPVLNQLWKSLEQQFGPITKEPTAKKVAQDTVHRNITYTFTSKSSPLNVIVRMDANGLVDDIYISPEIPDVYQKPSYDNPNTYTEEAITIGEGKFTLPGTLTLPKGEGPFPVVILVHGSGANNQDEAIGGAKPFRDLAVGLASQGIATVRYDKVTYTHSYKITSQPKFALKHETVDDANRAVLFVKSNKKIKPDAIFVAGHSQGGFALPLIIANDTGHDIAGGISLAGPSTTFADVIVEQTTNYVSRAKELGLDVKPYEQQAEYFKGFADLLNDKQYSKDNLPKDFPLPSAYWWYEQRDYVPTELAKTQNTPLFIIQGENDIQVSMKQFNGWKTALQTHTNVSFKSYPNVNHILASYEKPSIAQEYLQPSNVSEQIIQDIAKWVVQTSK
jgi:fermentation-respiration switch protein FrsA (DUF1100 family)